jgi:hypothetical protein
LNFINFYSVKRKKRRRRKGYSAHVIKFVDKTDSRRAKKRRKVGLASRHPALITNETKKEASSQFERTNKQNIK